MVKSFIHVTHSFSLFFLQESSDSEDNESSDSEDDDLDDDDLGNIDSDDDD